MDPMNIHAKFEVRSFIHSWDNRGYSKNFGSPCIRPRSTFSQIFNRLLFAWTIWIYLPNLTFVALPIPEIIGGTPKNLGSPWIRQPSLFCQIFKGLLFAWTPWIYLPSLKFVALPVPEIMRVLKIIWAVPVYAHAPFSPQFLIGFCSHEPSEYICQVWRS